MKMRLSANMQAVLLLLTLLVPCNGILPDLVHPGIHLILGSSMQEDERAAMQVEQLAEDQQRRHPHKETTIATAIMQAAEEDNHIDTGCVSTMDCGKERYCLHDKHNSKCQPCKGTDTSCKEDEECCGVQLCVWGQCSPNATKGQAGNTCQHQAHCNPDLCCAFHAALLFPVCSAKPIDREQCFPTSNHLMEEDAPRKHCPCAGDLHCQHMGRGSMCLKLVDSSEEELTDSLYSAIDYIL